MFFTPQLILLALKIIGGFIDLARNQQLMDAGQDKAIAQAAASILVKTQAAKEVMKEVTAMTDAQVDASLKGLEP